MGVKIHLGVLGKDRTPRLCTPRRFDERQPRGVPAPLGHPSGCIQVLRL